MNAIFTVILPAAGNSTRFAHGDKLMVDLAGKSILQRSVELFAAREDVAAIIIAAGAERLASYREHLQPVLCRKALHFTTGGSERWESVYKALCSDRVTTEFVAIHDAARPLTPAAVIDAAFAGAAQHGAALPVLAEPATLKRLNADRLVTGTVSRAGLYQAQTPQCFRTDALRLAFSKMLSAGGLEDITDDAQLMERSGAVVYGTAGSPLNLKITLMDDVRLAAAILHQADRSPQNTNEFPAGTGNPLGGRS